ncbi:hypothetical protein IFM89_036644 [Coptis chinensis]|uniref:Glucose-methanol-choline oxidoreductase N-terminal domain-containing protein n=1 Tax=Coptis chinensis TaxID=261450 RepID=A0A835M392_9MAGN|nr:hypothetical protein IFM89_036644 [Coptis chinensis]
MASSFLLIYILIILSSVQFSCSASDNGRHFPNIKAANGVINARAKVLGGGSAINAGFYTRADPSFIEKAGWDAELVNQSYPWVEEQIVKQPNIAPWQEAVRRGVLEVGVVPDNGNSYEHKYGTKVGGTIFDEDGTRHTAAELLASANPNNLHVYIHANVEKIIFNSTDEMKPPRTAAVKFRDEKGKRHLAFLSSKEHSEVFLSSGAIGSPQLLLLSGVGPAANLKRLKIPVVQDNRNVGKGLADNPLNSIFIPTKKPVKQSLIRTVGITKLGVFIEASSGFSQSSDSIQTSRNYIGKLSTIPPKQRTEAAIQAYRKRKPDLPHEVFNGGFILEKIAGPLSTGELRLKNTNISDNPIVTFNYFTHPYDLKRCVDGIRLVEKIVRTKCFAKLTNDDKLTMDMILNMSVTANVNLIPKHTNDTKSLKQFCKDTVITIWHYHGGCHVDKVVDRNHRVLGVDGLRVVDGSVFSETPGTNPQATVMMRERLERAGNNLLLPQLLLKRLTNFNWMHRKFHRTAGGYMVSPKKDYVLSHQQLAFDHRHLQGQKPLNPPERPNGYNAMNVKVCSYGHFMVNYVLKEQFPLEE